MKTISLLILILHFQTVMAQNKTVRDSSYIIILNQQIDNYVMQHKVAALDTLYAADFVFSHGTGLIEGKAGWLTAVAKNNYPLRQHDSVSVEMHSDLAIARGKMSVQRADAGKTALYTVWYVRIFSFRTADGK